MPLRLDIGKKSTKILEKARKVRAIIIRPFIVFKKE